MNKLVSLFVFSAVAPLIAADLPTINVFEDETEPAVKKPRPIEEPLDEIPNWVSELSNLPADKRQLYVNQFAAAKWAYSKGALDMCHECLDACDAIYSKNPNVWNLRASAYISSGSFAAAEIWLKKVREVAPDDLVANLNYSLLYLGVGQFEKCIEECDILMGDIEYNESLEPLMHSLTFRKFISLIMLDRVDEAKELVKDITPLTFTPLYYYTQAVLAIVEDDPERALNEMRAADSIYRTDPYLVSYKQAIQFTNILKTFVKTTEAE